MSTQNKHAFGRRLWAGAVVVGLTMLPMALIHSAQASSKDGAALVSRASGKSGAVGDGHAPSLSKDGRFVAFESAATLAGEPAHPGVVQVFVRDTRKNTTLVVSRASGKTGAVANAFSDAPSISADGRFVAFESRATNLVTGYHEAVAPMSQIYVRDLKKNTTVLVSHIPGSYTFEGRGNGTSEDPAISADGHSVAYTSDATNLTADVLPTAGISQVFVTELEYDTTVLASRHSGAAGAIASPGTNEHASLSGDGKLLTWASEGTNLVDGITAVDQVYVRNLDDNITTLVSRQTGVSGPVADDGAGGPSISANGKFVVFTSGALNLGEAPGCTSGFGPCDQVYVRDLVHDITTMASFGPNGQGNDSSGPAVISADGQTVAFESDATNLGAGSPCTSTPCIQVYVREWRDGTTTVASRASDTGAVGNHPSTDPAISGDGDVVAFESDATNLTTDATGGATTAFLRMI